MISALWRRPASCHLLIRGSRHLFGSDSANTSFVGFPFTSDRSFATTSSSVPLSPSQLSENASSKSVSPLTADLHRQILFSGPITVAEYMRQCLTHPTHGYYTTNRNIFGARGDFVTAPDVSPVFSELIAIWVAHYVKEKCPTSGAGVAVNTSTHNHPPFRLVELGAGNCSLMRTVLPTLARLKCTPQKLTLVDASEHLKETQKKVLDGLPSEVVPDVEWTTSAEDALVPDRKSVDNSTMTITIAHEFLDALPIHVFQRVQATPPESGEGHGSQNSPQRVEELSKQWRERLVDALPLPSSSTTSPPDSKTKHNTPNPAFRFVLARSATPASALLSTLAPREDETIIEGNAAAQSITRLLAQRAQHDGGAALLIDYGGMHRRHNGSLRALRRHAPADILREAGLCDVTADVDFGTLARVTRGEGARFMGAVTQRAFLLRMGIAERFRVVGRGVVERGGSDDEVDGKLKRLQQDYERLVGEGSDAMGNVYKVASICPRDVHALAGFEDAT